MAELSHDISTLGGVAGQIKESGNRAYIYAYVTASTKKGTPLFLDYDGDEASNPKGSTPATNDAIYAMVIFTTSLQGDTAGFQWCQFRGDAEVLCNGTVNIAKDDYLEVLNTGTALVKDSASKTTGSIAIAQEAQIATSDTLTNVYLLGERVFIQAT